MTSMASITSAVTTALTQTSSDVLGMIATVLPAALAIVGAVLAIRIGIKQFKSVANK